MVWGLLEGFGLWPGLVQNWDSRKPCGSMRKVVFFGNRMQSEVESLLVLPKILFHLHSLNKRDHSAYVSIVDPSRRSRALFFVC